MQYCSLGVVVKNRSIFRLPVFYGRGLSLDNSYVPDTTVRSIIFLDEVFGGCVAAEVCRPPLSSRDCHGCVTP